MSDIGAIVASAASSAQAFTERYYADLDSASPPERAALVQALYLPTSRITWNGNPIPYADLPAFVEQLPKSSHEVQAFDCHPIAGSGTVTPALVVSVTGQVTHGDDPAGVRTAAKVSAKDFEYLPRVFSQSFILVPDPRTPQQGAGELKYAISADAFRFC